MGRGSSKAGGGSSGGATTSASGANSLPTPTNYVTPPTPQQVANGNVLPTGGTPFSSFESMTDDEKADVVDKALKTGVPMFLDDSGMQRFAYFTGMSDKPTVVTDSQLDNVKGTEMFRTVNDAYNSRTDIGYSSGDIADQISNGDFTMYSDSGGSAHGRGIYFATDYYDSSLYGNRGQNPKTLRAKITSDKVVSEGKISQEYSRALQRGDKLATACSQARGADARNLYALAKGHDVIKADYGSYVVVLNRRAMTVSSTVKNTKIGGSSW